MRLTVQYETKIEKSQNNIKHRSSVKEVINIRKQYRSIHNRNYHPYHGFAILETWVVFFCTKAIMREHDYCREHDF